MKKKAQFTELVISYIPKIFLLSLVFVAIVVFVNRYTMDKLDVQKIEASLLIDRMVYSRNCFSYIDEKDGTNRPYPGIIDLDKFTSANLDSCIFYGVDSEGKSRNIYTAASVILKDSEGNVLKTIYHNEAWYKNWQPIVDKRGPGGTKSYRETNYILYYKEGKLERGKLEFDVIIPNS